MTRRAVTTVSLEVSGTYTNLLTDEQAPGVRWGTGALSLALATGDAADQSNRVWSSKARTLTSGNSETIDIYDFGALDLGAGAGKDQLGQAIAAATISMLTVVVAKGASAGALHVDTTLTNGNTGILNGIVKLKPTASYESVLMIFVPSTNGTITDATNNLVRFSAVGGDVTYSIHLTERQ